MLLPLFTLIGLLASTLIRPSRSLEPLIGRSTQDSFDSDQESIVLVPMGALTSSASVQCEQITLSFCSQMPYQSTRMPNFFKDSSQIEAVERALLFKALVNSRCSSHIHDYICELLTPVCLEDSHEAMKRFEIYPCRSFCRKVKRDCEHEIVSFNQHLFNQGSSSSILTGFACDQLPFESNGGNGSLRGPCHETPEPVGSASQQQASAKSNYSPYQPSLDANIPPFITDTSRIDSNMIRPAINEQPDSQQNRLKPTQDSPQDRVKQQQQQNFLGHLQNFGQSLLWALIRYSNVLSILTVLCLLAALNSKRLRRLKSRLSFSPSNSSKGSSSTASSQRHLHNSAKLPTFPPNQSVSPSASSRSLMLIAGSSKHQAPSHQLLPVEPCEPSQKLLHGLSQKTLININNGTLERQLNQNNNRYKMMQSAACKGGSFVQHSDKQQLFNTLDSQSSSNQYDCIQVSDQNSQYTLRARQQQQLYSNILLSSPNHQVLLCSGSQQQQQANSAGRQFGQLPGARATQLQAPNRGHAPYLTTSLSPYAAPGGLSLGSGDSQYQRSFQRRSRKGSMSSQQQQLQLQRQLSGRAGYTSASSSASSGGSSHSTPSSAFPPQSLNMQLRRPM